MGAVPAGFGGVKLVNPRLQFFARASLAFLHDAVASGVAWLAAFWLRFNFDVPPEYQKLAFATLPWVIGVYAAVFWGLGLYRGVWRYASFPDLQRILMAVGLAALAVSALFLLYSSALPVPRSAFVVTPMLLVGAMGGSRFAYRAWKEGRFLSLLRTADAEPVIVLGAGPAVADLLRTLAESSEWRVIALLDDAEHRHGGEIHGVKVLGPLERVSEVAGKFSVTQAIIAMPDAPHAERRRAADLCAAAGLKAMTVPAYADIVSGKVSVSQLRSVELDDLLGRDPVKLDDEGLHELLRGRSVLVTGAGGSIGSELCRQIAAFAPSRLVMFEQSEFALYTIEQEFGDRFPAIAVEAVIGDARSEARVGEILRRFAPQVVFHAAAYKHVPLMEGTNAFEAVANNALSTIATARACLAAGVEKYVLVSTDKAVNPTNVMGASKRLAELICLALHGQGRTRFVTVRFGNVLGSTGSVVPRFRAQIERGGPITVTHPEIARYFMSIPEAAQLVLQAALMGNGGEIFVLDMGEPVRIADLARQLIALSGVSEREIGIVYTGLRPGEKLREELLGDPETVQPTSHPKVRVARANSSPSASLVEEIVAWIEEPVDRDPAAVRARLRAWIPEYASAAASVQRTT